VKISTRARYALRFMIDLAKHREDAPVILRDVATRQDISKRYLDNLATGLKNASLVRSIPGRGGGYCLLRAPGDIPISEIISATIGPINVVDCVKNPEMCERADRCTSRMMWLRLNNAIDEVFDAYTLADLCQDDCRSVGSIGSMLEAGGTPESDCPKARAGPGEDRGAPT
jgi:Rrf2 family protein